MVSLKSRVLESCGSRWKTVSTSIFAKVSVSVALACLSQNAEAAGVIKRPGAHNHYEWELEPQLVIRTNIPYWNGGNGNWTGFGPGVRASIPLMHNGPIDSINNNIAISFGGSMTWHGNNTNVTVLNLPVAFQWNFYFTEIVSVLGETGLNTPITFANGNTQFDVEPFIQGGGRFQWDKVGVIVRIGYPSFSVGANFQF
jgi:hypothetical protein